MGHAVHHGALKCYQRLFKLDQGTALRLLTLQHDLSVRPEELLFALYELLEAECIGSCCLLQAASTHRLLVDKRTISKVSLQRDACCQRLDDSIR